MSRNPRRETKAGTRAFIFPPVLFPAAAAALFFLMLFALLPQQAGAETASPDEEGRSGSKADNTSGSDRYLEISYGLSASYHHRHTFIENQYKPATFYEFQRVDLAYRSPMLDIVADGGLNGDMEYSGGAEQKYAYDRYFDIRKAFFEFHPDSFTFKAGRFPLQDEVESPYALYLSEKENPHLSAEFSYSSPSFRYRSGWTELNRDSRYIYTGSDRLIGDDALEEIQNYYPVVSDSLEDPPTYPTLNSEDADEIPETDDDGIPWVDRGLSYRSYSFMVGDWTFGLQETAVFYGKSFEPEFVLNPVPMFVMQVITDRKGGRPWGKYNNIKSLMGFYAEVEREGRSGYGQFLIDDINANALPISGTSHGVQRVAWSFGGEREFSFGSIGFYHGGATKYSFSATQTFENIERHEPSADEIPLWYSSTPYEYAYYPASVLEHKNKKKPVDYRDNYIGYTYGENNLAFLIDYSNRFFSGKPFSFELYDSVEYVANGAKSPNNPWHEKDDYHNIGGSWYLLENTVEHVLTNNLDLSKEFGRLTLSLNLETGIIFNKMELERESEAEAYWFAPQKGKNDHILRLTIGGEYSFGPVSLP